MMKKLWILLVLVAILGMGLFPVFSASIPTITVDRETVFQTMDGIGGNYCLALADDITTAQDAIGRFTLAELRPRQARIPIILDRWEPVNDNDDPDMVNWEAYIDREGHAVHALFRLLQELKENGVEVFTASVWNTPAWMVSNPEVREGRIISAELYPEVAESMAAFLLRARDEYGVEISYVSFNECNEGIRIKFTSAELIAFIKVAGPKFRAMGLDKVKFLVGDTHSTGSLPLYAAPILKEESIRPYLGPISYHSWWSASLPNGVFAGIAKLGKQYDLPVWCAELGMDAMASRNPEGFPSWSHAWGTALTFFRVLKYSEASVVHFWSYQSFHPMVSPDGKTPYPVFYVLKQFNETFPPGSQVVQAESDHAKLWAIASKEGEGRFRVLIMNTENEAVKVKLSGLTGKTAQWYRTGAKEQMAAGGKLKINRGAVTLTLPPQSVNTVTCEQ